MSLSLALSIRNRTSGLPPPVEEASGSGAVCAATPAQLPRALRCWAAVDALLNMTTSSRLVALQPAVSPKTADTTRVVETSGRTRTSDQRTDKVAAWTSRRNTPSDSAF